MACIAAPPLPLPPPLPAGVTIPIYTPPTLPNLGLCCKIILPSIPLPFQTLTIPFPAAIVTALNGYIAAIQAYYDGISASCPLE
jgi:hypothetical protein